MDKKAINVFDDMLTTTPKKEVKPAKEEKPVKVSKPAPVAKPVEHVGERKPRPLKLRGNYNTTAEASKSICYRTTPGFYELLQDFAKVKGLSMNTIIETALLQYMDLPENREDTKLARSIAERVR